MIEITGDDIARLNDSDLRRLVALLCESEARRLGLPSSCVTAGGDQNAADGGVDVRVAFPLGTKITGFIPCPATGFQVKKSDMPRNKILTEMRPSGEARPVIRELAEASGAYVIVSSKGSTAEKELKNRRAAMTEAVQDVSNHDVLTLDFYDRNRLATWVRDHPGLIPWVREKIGQAIQGWQSYGAWAYPSEGEDAEYILDDAVRIQTGRKEDGNGLNTAAGLERIRELLRKPRQIVRLVGLSGVGKTRFIQALFDARVGESSLEPSLAFYTNIVDDPEPQPIAVASDLINAGTRAILVIDNCTPELHRRLSELCRGATSSLSVITVEYDIRDDEPEATEVFTLEASSPELIVTLIDRRYPHVSRIDAQTIADFSGGNSRIALAIAGTIEKNETIAGLTDEDLFGRLFHQRHAQNDSLLLAAQSCSLVYSFQGEDVSAQSELVILGATNGISPEEMFRHVAELSRRDLVQHRSEWRAVLPHAIANRLAVTALQNVPYTVLEKTIVNSGSDRLMKSFSRRLGYLHDSNDALAIVTGWLSNGGMLGNVASANELGRTMFHNVAPVAPELALATLERAKQQMNGADLTQVTKKYVRLLRSIAYEGLLFERCAALISSVATESGASARPSDAVSLFVSLFFLYYSGTHATIEQRLRVIEPLLLSEDVNERALGVAALKNALEAWQYGSSYDFEFGARSRNYGYWPKDAAEVRHWFALVLNFAEKIANSDLPVASQVRSAIAEKFHGLWHSAGMNDELERVCRSVAAKRFWREGWIAVRQAVRFEAEDAPPDLSARLKSLQDFLKPKTLVENARSVLLSTGVVDVDPEDLEDSDPDLPSGLGRTDMFAVDLGKQVATDASALKELVAELVSVTGQRFWLFGRGLAEGATNLQAIWDQLTSQLAKTAEDRRNIQVLCGFLESVSRLDPKFAAAILDAALEDDILAPLFPVLQTAVTLDQNGINRLKRSIVLNKATMWNYRSLMYGRATDPIPGADLREMLLGIADKPDGVDVAIEILYMRLHLDTSNKRSHAPEIIEAGGELLARRTFATRNDQLDYRLKDVAKVCLVGENAATITREICRKLKASASNSDTQPYEHDDLLEGLFSAQPTASLDGFLDGVEAEVKQGISFIKTLRHLKKNPLDFVPMDTLLAWCEANPGARYNAAAAVVTISQQSETPGCPKWTNVARGLLDNAPDRIEVLKRFGQQFRPKMWSGSRAALIESNAKLLDQLVDYPDPAVATFIAQEKCCLAAEVDAERRFEAQLDRKRDERFE